MLVYAFVFNFVSISFLSLDIPRQAKVIEIRPMRIDRVNNLP